MIAAAEAGASLLFIEVGVIVVALAVLAGLAHRLGITAIPFYLVAGLAVGNGGRGVRADHRHRRTPGRPVRRRLATGGPRPRMT